MHPTLDLVWYEILLAYHVPVSMTMRLALDFSSDWTKGYSPIPQLTETEQRDSHQLGLNKMFLPKWDWKKGFYSSQTASVSKRTLAIVSRNWSVRIIIMTSERDLKLPLLPGPDARVWALPHGGSTRLFCVLLLESQVLSTNFLKSRIFYSRTTSTPVESFLELFPLSTTLSKGWFKKQFVL